MKRAVEERQCTPHQTLVPGGPRIGMVGTPTASHIT